MTAILGNNPKRQTVQYDELKMATQSAMSNRKSVLSKILAIKLSPQETLIDLLNTNPTRFISIVISEIYGWINASINKTTIFQNIELRERFDNLKLELETFSQTATTLDSKEVYAYFIRTIEHLQQIERIPGNSEYTVFELQYELRLFATIFFEEGIFEFAKQILDNPLNSSSFQSVSDIYRYSITLAYNISTRFFFSDILSEEIQRIDSSIIDLDGLRCKMKELKTKFVEIIFKYYPSCTEAEFLEYLKGTQADYSNDYQTVEDPFCFEGYNFEENEVRFIILQEDLKGHSYVGHMTPLEEKNLDGNLASIGNEVYKVHSHRQYKDCGGFSSLIKFLNYLEKKIRVDEYGEIYILHD